MNRINAFFEYIFTSLKNITVMDVLDIFIVTVMFYLLYKFVKGRRAEKLAVGIMLFFALLALSSLAEMNALNFVLRNLVQVGLIAIFIVFQPELRSMLEQVGEQPIKSLNRISQSTKISVEKSIDQLCEAATEFSLKHTGALIVLERKTKLGDVIKTGTVIDAECTLFLIRNIFFDKAPLHDGAAIVRNGRLYAAGCFLPLSTQEIDLNLGTRHRAGLGMSENSDALVIIVSEETGNISVAQNGVLKNCNSISELKKLMKKELLPENDETQKNIKLPLFGKKKNSTDSGKEE